MSQQQIQDEEVIVVDATAEPEEPQQQSAPAGGDESEAKPDTVLPWGDPNKPPKKDGKD